MEWQVLLFEQAILSGLYVIRKKVKHDKGKRYDTYKSIQLSDLYKVQMAI